MFRSQSKVTKTLILAGLDASAKSFDNLLWQTLDSFSHHLLDFS